MKYLDTLTTILTVLVLTLLFKILYVADLSLKFELIALFSGIYILSSAVDLLKIYKK